MVSNVIKENDKYLLQISAVVISCLSAVSDGLLAAWSSPYIGRIIEDKEHFNITETEASYFAIIPPIALSLGCILFTKLSELIGRKMSLLMVAVPQLSAWILKALATNVYVFYVARFLAGISSGCVFSVLPIYISEVISPKIRGTLGSFLTTMHFTGQFIVNVLGNYCQIKTTSYICIPIVIIFVGLFSLMPESPYYLIMMSKNEQAKQSLRRLLRKTNIDQTFTILKKDIERQLLEKGTWKELIINETNRKALSVAIFLRVVQQLGGIGVFVAVIKYLFENAGGAIRPDISTLVYTFSIIPFYFMAGFIVDRTGRRPAFVTSMSLSGCFLLLESIYFYIDKNLPGTDVSSINWFPTVGMLLYVMVSSFGPGIIPTLMIGEIFSSRIKCYGTIAAVFIFGILNFVASQVFFLLNTYVGLFGPFLLFGCVNLLGAIGGYFYLPETKGKTLEEIQQDFKRNRTETILI